MHALNNKYYCYTTNDLLIVADHARGVAMYDAKRMTDAELNELIPLNINALRANAVSEQVALARILNARNAQPQGNVDWPFTAYEACDSEGGETD